MVSAFSWIKVDETAKEALVGILSERPFVLLPPPLHRLPFRVGNVVEIVGPSPSAKTLILIQAAINCILPKEWKGVQCGGLERALLFIDLDCRFDVLSLSRALERRIAAISGIKNSVKKNGNGCDSDLFTACMKRFLYTRCYNSFEFLSTLKTLPYRLQKEKDNQGSAVYILMIDRIRKVAAIIEYETREYIRTNIGAFYWMDRALPYSSTGNNRKSLSLQTLAETIVQEIQRVLRVHPMLVLATKSATFSDKQSATELMRKSGKRSDEKVSETRVHREYMPLVWQSFVSHRIFLRPSDNESSHQNHHRTFSTEWLLPSVKFSDNFTINDGLLVTL